MIYGYRLVGNALNIVSPRAIIIANMCAIIHIVVIHYGSLVYIVVIIVGASPVMHAIGLIHILRAYKYPPT